ncbi:MAG: hypothetical protein E6Q53_01585 [Candidatus Moraniibacteriota bacterium]|nr:MAG: hypothetical protein E6Q53_01585 [Candidatus Moranbacteria bacterium]
MDELTAFGLHYRRYLRGLELAFKYLPFLTNVSPFKTIERRMSPFFKQVHAMSGSMAAVLPQAGVPEFRRAWLDSHALFARHFLEYRRIDHDWVKKNVVVEEPALLKEVVERGGVLLTYHTHHQNTLCCILGVLGSKVSAVAAAPEASPLYPVIGTWAVRVNADSAIHFRGGRYIFTNDLRALARDVRTALQESSVVVCLADFTQQGSKAPNQRLFGRYISPPTGVIELGIKLETPFYFSVLAPESGVLKLKLRKFDDFSPSLNAVVSAYVSYLQECILVCPSLWQGWEWFGALPDVPESLS